jgi:hypothetical protein
MVRTEKTQLKTSEPAEAKEQTVTPSFAVLPEQGCSEVLLPQVLR